MSCKCYKTINKPYSYVKSTRHGYKRITEHNGHFMVQCQAVELSNHNRELYCEITPAEFDAVWDRFTAICTDIDIEANDEAFQAGCRIEDRVISAREKL